MSDLVETVHSAVSSYCAHTSEDVSGKCVDCDLITRRAIRAVLAHFSDPSNITAFRKGQHEVVAAAMAAALKEMEPKP